MLAVRTLTSNSRLQNPGSTGVSAGMSTGVLGVKTTSFGVALVAWVDDQVTPSHVVVIVESPSYSTMLPSSVQGTARPKSPLQSR